MNVKHDDHILEFLQDKEGSYNKTEVESVQLGKTLEFCHTPGLVFGLGVDLFYPCHNKKNKTWSSVSNC